MVGKCVKDLMVPLREYAVVPETATLREALFALETAQTQLPPGKPLHRAVLVADRKGRIVGKLGQHGFLKALEPKYAVLGDVEALAHAGLSEEFINSIMENFQFWQGDMEDVCRRARAVKVGQVMKPVAQSIEESRSLAEAIHMIVMSQSLSLLVTREGTVTGILRLSDVFAEVAAFVKSSECPGD